MEGMRNMTQIPGLSVPLVCRLPALAIAVTTLVLGAHPALAQDAATGAPSASLGASPGPLDLVKTSVAQVLAIVQSGADEGQRQAELRQVAATLFDFNDMGRRTLVQHWSERSRQEQ